MTTVPAPVETGLVPLVVGLVALGAAVLASFAIVRRLRITAHPRLSGRSPGA